MWALEREISSWQRQQWSLFPTQTGRLLLPIQSELSYTSHMSTYCYSVCVFLIGNGVIRIRPPLATATPLSPPLSPPIKFSSIVSATASHSSLGLGICSDSVCLAPFVIILLPVNSKQHVQPQRQHSRRLMATCRRSRRGTTQGFEAQLDAAIGRALQEAATAYVTCALTLTCQRMYGTQLNRDI